MLPRERLEIIKQIAISDGKVYVTKLSKELSVTKETIRKDLEKLEKEGIVIRDYGGAIVNFEIIDKEKTTNTFECNIENNKYIAEKVLDFICKGSTIAADYSLTALEALKLIKNRKDITVLTNSILALQELSGSELNLISTGGNVNHKLLSFQGAITQNIIKKYNVDIAIVDCKGMDISRGIFDSNEIEAEIKKTMVRQADKVILLVDHTKYNKTSLVKLFNYEEIDYIITDIKPEFEWLSLLDSYNVKIIY